MFRTHCRLLLSLLCCTLLTAPLPAAEVGGGEVAAGAQQRVAVVLSGGGAKGIAHIGLLQALEENDIPIDCIAGTSIGAVVGALYAAGLSPQEMMHLVCSPDFAVWQTGVIPDEQREYYRRAAFRFKSFRYKWHIDGPSALSPLLSRTTLIDPSAMKWGVMEVYSAAELAAAGQFDSLFVPFRAVASDVCAKRAQVFRSGNLGESVRASMAFPFVFQAPEVDGVRYYDGGIYNNFPVDVAQREFAPSFVIGCVVADNPECPADGDLIGQLEQMVVQRTDYHIADTLGVCISILQPDVGLLDFRRAERIYSVGYEAGLRYADSIRSRLPATLTRQAAVVERRRRSYRLSLPPFDISAVHVTGVTPAQHTFVMRHFAHPALASLRSGYYRLAADDRITDLTLRRTTDSLHRQHLHVGMRVRRHLDLRLGGLLTTLRHSRLYLGAGYRSLHSFAGNADIDVQLGESYRSALATLRAEVPTRYPFVATWRVGWNEQRYARRDFILPAGLTTTPLPPAVLRRESVVSEWAVELPVGHHGLWRPQLALEQRDYVAAARLLRFGCDFRCGQIPPGTYATRGYDLHLALLRHAESGRDGWNSATLSAVRYWAVARRFSVGTALEAVWSNLSRSSDPWRTWAVAPEFRPYGHASQLCYAALRARRYLAPGLSPVLRLGSRGQLRLDVHAFVPAGRGAVLLPAATRSPMWVGDLSVLIQTVPADCVAFLHLGGQRGSTTTFAVGFRIGFLQPDKLFRL